MTQKIYVSKNFSSQEYFWFSDRNYDNCLHEVHFNTVKKAIFIN